MYNKISIFCCICLLFGCNDKPDNNTELKIIDIVEGISSSGSTLFLSEVAEDIDFVALETTDESLIGSMFYAVFSDKYIAVLDNQQDLIFLFARNGKFLRRIGSKGQGPGEYIDPAMIALSGDNLFLWDYKLSLLCYDVNTGKCLHEKHLIDEYGTGHFDPVAIGCINDSLLVCYTASFPDIDFKDFMHLYVTNYDFTATYSTGKYTGQLAGDGLSLCRYTKDGDLHVWRSDDNTIYRINTEITPAYKLSLGKYDLIGKTNNFGDKRFLVIDIHESNNFFFIIGIFNHDYGKCIVYDKFTKKSKYLGYVAGYGGNFHNDIDGSINFWPRGYVSKNVLYSYIPVMDLKTLMEHPYTKSIEIKNKEKHQKIKDYLLTANDDDNPIIFLVTMK
jgi:hypothetical protein